MKGGTTAIFVHFISPMHDYFGCAFFFSEITCLLPDFGHFLLIKGGTSVIFVHSTFPMHDFCGCASFEFTKQFALPLFLDLSLISVDAADALHILISHFLKDSDSTHAPRAAQAVYEHHCVF